MRVLNPLTLARRRQLCAAPMRPRSASVLADECNGESFDLREEPRLFADALERFPGRDEAE